MARVSNPKKVKSGFAQNYVPIEITQYMQTMQDDCLVSPEMANKLKEAGFITDKPLCFTTLWNALPKDTEGLVMWSLRQHYGVNDLGNHVRIDSEMKPEGWSGDHLPDLAADAVLWAIKESYIKTNE